MADPDLEYDLANAEHGRISLIHGRPWDEVPPNTTVRVHWLDDSLRRPWEQEEWEQEQHEKREQRERLERMSCLLYTSPSPRDS